MYHFEIPASQSSTGTPISQQMATLAALNWAKGFYNANNLRVDSIQYEPSPNPHYLAQLTGDVGGASQTVYAAVLPDGKIVRPTAGPASSGKETGKSMKKAGRHRHSS